MPMIVNASPNGNQLTLPHPLFVSSVPASGETLTELDPVHSFWTSRAEPWYSVDVDGFSLNELPAASVSLTAGVYDAEADIGLWPEESRIVLLRAETLGGYTALEIIGFSTRGGFGSINSLGEIVSGYTSSPNAEAEITRDVGGTSSAPGSLALNKSTSGGGVVNILRSYLLGSAGFADIAAAVRAGSETGRLTLTPYGLSGDSTEAALFVMTLGGGAADTGRARLTVKLDFIQLLALRSAAVSLDEEETALGSVALDGEMNPLGMALRLLRVAGFKITEGGRASVEITREEITEMLRSAGAGREEIAEALRGFEALGGGGLLVEFDLIDEILNEGR